ncbi:DUF4371 domain-containing protein [Plasmodiophora brassicae]
MRSTSSSAPVSTTGGGAPAEPSASLKRAAPDNADDNPPKKLSGGFKLNHRQQYGLVNSDRDPGTSAVTGVKCRCCITFGREVETCKTQWTFKGPPFRTYNYRVHLEKQHASKWATYQTLSDAERAVFFDVPVKEAETLPFYFGARSEQLEFKFDKPIVDALIGQLLWRPEDVGTLAYTKAMSIFQLDGTGSGYTATVKEAKQFQLVIRFLARGMSFRMATSAVNDAKLVTGYAKLGCASEVKVATFARIQCAANFQSLASCLRRQWAFSIALDGAVCDGTGYIDVRVRFCDAGRMQNRHVIAAPLFGSHTGEAMFNMVCQLFDVLCPTWTEHIIGSSTDGAANMTGRLSGVQTRLQAVALPGFMRIWCYLHQLDLVLQDSYQNFDGDHFYRQTTATISHLRRQYSLIGEMGETCPALSKTRWSSMARVTTFFHSNRDRLMKHYHGRSDAPSQRWWLTNSALNVVAVMASETVARCQGKEALFGHQFAELRGLFHQVKKLAFATESHPTTALCIDEFVDMIVIGPWTFRKDNLKGMLMDQGLFEAEAVEGLDVEDVDFVVHSTATLLSGIMSHNPKRP